MRISAQGFGELVSIFVIDGTLRRVRRLSPAVRQTSSPSRCAGHTSPDPVASLSLLAETAEGMRPEKMTILVNYFMRSKGGLMRDRTNRWLSAKNRARIVIVVIALLAAGLAQGCRQTGDIGGVPPGVPSAGPMVAEGRVVSQPRGGTNVTELSCEFEMSEAPGDGTAPVAVHVSWVAPCGTHRVETFAFEGGTETFESTYTEGGYPIGMTFWAVITWADARGQHRIQSAVAVCTVQ